MNRLILMLLAVLLLAVGITANAQQPRKAKPKPKRSGIVFTPTAGGKAYDIGEPVDVPQSVIAKPDWMPNGGSGFAGIGGLVFRDGKWRFEGDADASVKLLVEELNKQSRCTSAVLLAALDDALKEFVIDPNPSPVWFTGGSGFVTFAGSPTVKTITLENLGYGDAPDLRTPAQKLRDQAAELERKSELAKRIRQIRDDCSLVVSARWVTSVSQ